MHVLLFLILNFRPEFQEENLMKGAVIVLATTDSKTIMYLSYPPAASSRRTRGIIADLERDQDGFMKTGQANDAWRRIEIMMGLVMRCGTWQVVGTMGESSWTTGTFKNIDYEHNDRSYRFADSRGCNSRLMQVRRHMLCEFDPNLC